MNNHESKITHLPLLKCFVNAEENRREYSIPRHQHCDYEFIFLISGNYEYQHNSYTGRLLPGQGFLLRPGDWHIDRIYANTHYQAVNFIIKDDELDLQQEHIDEKQLVVTDVNGTIQRILRDLQRENNTSDIFAPPLKNVYLQELYWQVMRLMPHETIDGNQFRDTGNLQLAKALRQAAMRHISRTVSLPELATLLKLSPRTLNNRCHEFFAMSPLKAFMKIKMEIAVDFLTQTSMSVKEISEYLGFQNPYHFSKAFLRIMKISPSQCRKSRQP